MRLGPFWLALATAAIVTGGCSSVGQAEKVSSSSVSVTTAVPATTAASTTTLAPTTTVDPMESAKNTYFAIAAASNVAIDAAGKRYRSGDSIPWAKSPAYCREQAQLAEDFVRRIQAVTWPAQVQDVINKLIDAEAAFAGALYSCANAPGTASAQSSLAADRQAIATAEESAVATVRIRLGLTTDR